MPGWLRREPVQVLLASNRSSWAAESRETLVGAGFVVAVDPTGGELVDPARAFDLAVIDLGLVGPAGIAQLRAQRSTALLGVVFPPVPEDLVAEACAAGVDSCFTRPTRQRELLARVSALMRRVPPPVPKPDALPAEVDGLALGERTIRVGDREVTLLPDEGTLLRALLASPGRVVPRREIRVLVPRLEREADLDALVRRLRIKLELLQRERRIWTVRGVGFTYRPAPMPAPLVAEPRPLPTVIQG